MKADNLKLLFIAPSFFGYTDLIKEQLIIREYDVDFFYDFYNSSSYNHLLRNYKVFGKFNTYVQKKYLSKIIITQKEFDIFFLIKGQFLTEDFIDKLKINNPKAKFVMYQWDSKEVFDYEHYMKYFDEVLSFDIIDCTNDNRLKLFPTFYTYKASLNKAVKRKFDLFFIGTYKPFRPKLMENIAKKAQDKGITTHFIFLSLKQYFKALIKPNKLIHFIAKPYTQNQIEKLIEQSKAVIDLCNPKQTGITQRALDTMAMKRKLITNNPYIIKEPYYSSQNVFIFNGNIDDLETDFLNTPFSDVDLSNYSVEGFVSRLITHF